jgi:hypothetical protein
MSPSKMVYVIPNMSVFHSFEFDKDKIYACHLSSDEKVAKIYHFKSSIQRREKTNVCRGSLDLKDEVESCSPVSSQQVFSQKLPNKECTLSKKIKNEKRLLSSSVSFSSCVTSLCNNNRCDKVGDDENEINKENDLSTTLKRGTKRKIDEVVGSETILPHSKREKNQINSNFDSNILAPQKISNSNINRDMSLGSMVVKGTQLPKTSSLICEVSLEGNGAGFMSNSVLNPQPMSQTSMNSFVSPRRIILTLNFPSQTTNSSPSSLSISSFHSCSSTKLSTCCSSSLISSYSSSSSLSSSVLLQRKSQGEMETGENNFLSQIQSFRQYIFAGSLSEYPEERKELQSSTSPSTSGFIV